MCLYLHIRGWLMKQQTTHDPVDIISTSAWIVLVTFKLCFANFSSIFSFLAWFWIIYFFSRNSASIISSVGLVLSTAVLSFDELLLLNLLALLLFLECPELFQIHFEEWPDAFSSSNATSISSNHWFCFSFPFPFTSVDRYLLGTFMSCLNRSSNCASSS